MCTFTRTVVLTMLGATWLAPATLPARSVAVDDLYALRTVAEPEISPDGAWVAYTVTTADRERDQADSDLWMVSWDGRQSVRLTSSPASDHWPRWSPDGRHLAFLSDRGDPKKPEQVFLLDRRGGEARQIGNFDGGASDFAWAPDGRRLVVVAEVAPDKKADDKPQPIVIDRFQFKVDMEDYLGRERSHLFILDVETGVHRQLTDGAVNELMPAWSPDGGTIAFATKRGEDPDTHNNWDIYLIEPRAGAEARQLTTNPGSDGDAGSESGGSPHDWSPDGSRLTYLHGGRPADLWYALAQLGVIAASGGEASLPTSSLDRNTIAPRWSHDGRWVYFLLEDDQSVQLARARLRDGRIERLTAPGRTVSEFDTGARGRTVLVSSTSDRPAELQILEGGVLRPITHHNDAWLKDLELAKAEAIEFRSPDGLEIHGLVMKPIGFQTGVRYPALLNVHGGPVGQFQHEFDLEWQLFAANGYVVVAPNPRGSSGRGFEFQRRLFAQWGYVDVPDVLAAVDHVVVAGFADPQRLGVGGWSYGGILTNYVIASDKRFKAATSGAGMSNMLGGYGIDMYVREWELELGLPWENTELWLRLSYPFLHADRIATPTLFICGALDYNVPLPASEQMYQALRRLGVPTQLVIYPEEHHGIRRPSFRHDLWQRYLEWYGKYVKETGTVTSIRSDHPNPD